MVANPLTARIDAGRDAYGVKLDIFEGPLDLLLFLIRKSEIDIYDIPIAAIAKQYLEYVDLMEQLNLEQAGDFVVMAATLMKIKSRMLLPAESGDGEEGEEDPRDELVRRLLEYQQTKEVATWMEDRQERFRDVFYRGTAIDREDPAEAEEGLGVWREVGLFDLMTAFQRAILVASQARAHHVEPISVTTEERVRVIVDVMERRGRASFADLVSGLSRITLVVTFVAVLEMIKGGRLVARQGGSSDDIWLYPASEDSTPPEALGNLETIGLAESLASQADAAPTGEEAKLLAEALGITPRKPPPWARQNGGSDGPAEATADSEGLQESEAAPSSVEAAKLVALPGDEPNAFVAAAAGGVSGDEPHVIQTMGGSTTTVLGATSAISDTSRPASLIVDGASPTETSLLGDEPHTVRPNPDLVSGDEPNTVEPSVEGPESNG